MSVVRVKFKGDTYDREDEGKPGKQDSQRNFIRRFLTFCTFNQSNHAVDKGVAGGSRGFRGVRGKPCSRCRVSDPVAELVAKYRIHDRRCC